MRKNTIITGMTLFFTLTLLSLNFAEESITITTYYPSPYGVYKNLRLYPNDDFTPGAACSNPGEMYYDNSVQTLYICSGSPSSTWVPAPGAITAGMPSGAVMFFNLASCPSGWTELVAARGRYIVGLSSGGTLAGVAGIALTNLENRAVGQHTHGIRANAGVGGASSCGDWNKIEIDWNADCGWRDLDASATEAGSVAGTNAPYIQLLACQKN